MWQRKAIKQSARKALKADYLQAVIVCLVLAVFVGIYPSQFTQSAGEEVIAQANFRLSTNSEIVNALLANANEDSPALLLGQSDATKGILATVFNNVTRSGSFVFGILNAVNQMFFGDTIMAGIIILVGTFILFLYWLLVGNLLRIGACRFFLESKTYPGAKANRLLYLYRIRRIRGPAKIMFLKAIYIVLWSFTIVGGFIKAYSYRMVPYIIAENPEISAKDAFALSRRMMHGNKWRTFVLDASFLGWSALSSVTFGLLGYLFFYPYQAATNAELYLRLRQTVPDASALLNDPYLCGERETGGQYPVNLYPIPEAKEMAWLNTDFMAYYSLVNVVLMFFTFCIGGWVWEVFVDLVNKGVLVNRGTLHGPWLPIYGTGGVAVVLLFRRFGKKPLLTFGLVTLFCGVLEYFTSWGLETFAGARWWDYSGYFLNIQGRVCMEGLLVFGIGGCLGIYFLAPALNNLFNKIPAKIKNPICISLIALFAADVVWSAISPNMAAATQDELPAGS